MRLLRSRPYTPESQVTLRLGEYHGGLIPRYAILSHTWESDEVLFSDVQNDTYRHKKGYSKVVGALNQAYKDGYPYVWIDTCCIDKSSSAELSEAINSMWTWYQEADMCYAFLQDVSADHGEDLLNEAFATSRWWTRGWTLQELLAPEEVQFFNSAWMPIGSKIENQDFISSICGIDTAFLNGSSPLESASIAKRMSWVDRRVTTREEDIAYCLMGIFSVNMPLLYGEGKRAFLRLQIEIMSNSDDQSIFAWIDPYSTADYESLHGLLADKPSHFALMGSVVPFTDWEGRKPYTMTNRGLSIELPLSPATELPNVFEAALHCVPSTGADGFFGIYLQKLPGVPDQYARIACHTSTSINQVGKHTALYVKQSHSARSEASVYPHCFFVLRSKGNSNIFYNYDITSVVPDLPAQNFYPKPVSHIEGIPTVFKVNTRAGKLTCALILRNKNIGTTTRPDIVVLLGSLSDDTVGFDIGEAGPSIPSKREAEKAFQPQPMGTVFELPPWKVTVTSEQLVEGGQNLHYIDIFMGYVAASSTVPLRKRG